MINSHAHVYGKFVVICTTHSSFSGLDVFMTVQRKNTDVSNGSGVTIVFDSKRCLSIVFNEKKTSCVSQCSPSLQLCRVSKEIVTIATLMSSGHLSGSAQNHLSISMNFIFAPRKAGAAALALIVRADTATTLLAST